MTVTDRRARALAPAPPAAPPRPARAAPVGARPPASSPAGLPRRGTATRPGSSPASSSSCSSALGGVLLFTSNDDRTDVLVAAADLQPGPPVERGDLRIERVAVDDDVPVDAAGRCRRTWSAGYPVGRGPGRHDAGAGRCSPTRSRSAADEVVFGAALDPGEAPLSGLEVGASVELLDVAAADPARRRSRAVARRVASGRGTVWAVEPIATGQLWVSLRVPRDVGARRITGLGRGHACASCSIGGDRMTLVVPSAPSPGHPAPRSLALGLAAAWPDAGRRRVVVEADPDGGRLGAELGVGVEPGLMALALAAAHGAGLTARRSRRARCRGRRRLVRVPAPPSSEQAHSALVHAAGVARRGDGRPIDGPVWIVDAGRLSHALASLAVRRGRRSRRGRHGRLVPVAAAAARTASRRCATPAAPSSVVVVEPTSWPTEEIAEFVGADVVAVLPAWPPRGDGSAAMRSSAWRPWWHRVEQAAAYLDVRRGAEVAASTIERLVE